MRSALFAETTAAMRINREEVLGPVVSVIRAKNYEGALALANAALPRPPSSTRRISSATCRPAW